MSLSARAFPGLFLSVLLLPQQVLSGQDLKFSGLAQVWCTAILSNNLRRNDPLVIPSRYYNLRSEFMENNAAIRRTELKVSGKLIEGIACEVSADPSQTIGPSNPSILLDADVMFTVAPDLDLKVGQYKTFQTLEGVTHSGDIPFAERSQLARIFGDIRDRGVALIWTAPRANGVGLRVTVAILDGVSDSTLGKGLDQNAQKDWAGRIDLDWGKHKLGAYTLQGSTDQRDVSGTAIAPNPGPYWPDRTAILTEKDRTTNLGAYYFWQTERWHVSAEAITGRLGRRFPTLGATLKREHLQQRYLGAYVTGGMLMGHHAVFVRYDFMDYNSGRDWYTPYNPYRESAPGVPLGADYTPRYTETTMGYTYAFKPGRIVDGAVKLNYIHRSPNFLKPSPGSGQIGEQGGDSMVLAFLVSF